MTCCDFTSTIARCAGRPGTHGEVVTSTSELSWLKASTPIAGSKVATTEPSETRWTTVDEADPACPDIDMVEFTAVNRVSALAIRFDGWLAMVLCERILPVDSCMTHISDGHAMTVRTRIAWSC